ncbi:hypothetical protein [Nostoc sp. PCC 7120 = FACHB-418]|nr:hypothetical protein [Nostoc sp. PCC 7120 = FACHB-418]
MEEHRAKPGISLQESIKMGYMSEDGVIAAVEQSRLQISRQVRN